MAEARIPVDLFNPGHVFACMGFVEVADILAGNAAGGFDWTDPDGVRFILRSAGESDPVVTVLAFLADASVKSLAPSGSGLSTMGSGWKVPTRSGGGDAFPFPLPDSPATLPVVLEDRQGRQVPIEHWGDATRRDAVKFWAGAGGYPGAALARDALELIRERAVAAASDPFNLSAPQSSSFRFDWRRDYVPMEIGFSPNDHGQLSMVGFPLVELLAAIGLQYARPHRLDRLAYRYVVVGEVVAPVFLRAALGGAPLPFARRSFRMNLGWPGQEGQARCILDVCEDLPS